MASKRTTRPRKCAAKNLTEPCPCETWDRTDVHYEAVVGMAEGLGGKVLRSQGVRAKKTPKRWAKRIKWV